MATGLNRREFSIFSMDFFDLSSTTPQSMILCVFALLKSKNIHAAYRELASVESRNHRRYSGAGLSNRRRLISKSAAGSARSAGALLRGRVGVRLEGVAACGPAALSVRATPGAVGLGRWTVY